MSKKFKATMKAPQLISTPPLGDPLGGADHTQPGTPDPSQVATSEPEGAQVAQVVSEPSNDEETTPDDDVANEAGDNDHDDPMDAPPNQDDVKAQLYSLLKIREIELVIPAQDGREGDARQTHVDVQRLTHLQERGLSLLFYGLRDARATFGPGDRLVDSKADAVRWLFEQIAAADAGRVDA